MSGDLGVNSAKASIRLAEKVLSWNLPGYVQLAGGTNHTSLSLAQDRALAIAGIAYGSYARQRVQEVLLQPIHPFEQPRDRTLPEATLQRAVAVARSLVNPLKSSQEITSYGELNSPVP